MSLAVRHSLDKCVCVCVLAPHAATLFCAGGGPYASCHPLPHRIIHTEPHKAHGSGGLPVLAALSVICPLAADLHTQYVHACIKQQGEQTHSCATEAADSAVRCTCIQREEVMREVTKDEGQDKHLHTRDSTDKLYSGRNVVHLKGLLAPILFFL